MQTINSEDILTVTTTKGVLQYYRNWEHEGAIDMINPQTIQRYHEIKNQQPDADKYGVFFAFSNEQFEEGYNRLIERGFIKDGDKVCRGFGGMYGTQNGITDFINFYDDRNKAIPTECDPQEVYFYEYNNHESMFAWDGDLEAIKLIIDYYGADIARNIKRYNASMNIENLIRKPIKIEGLYFITDDGEKKSPASIWFSDIYSEVSKKGTCYCTYDSKLRPVHKSDGKIYYNDNLTGLSASYNGKKIYDFRKE